MYRPLNNCIFFTNNKDFFDCIFPFFYLNPWGFSREGVVIQTIDLVGTINLAEVEYIYLNMAPLFFGRRIDILIETIKANHPHIVIKNIDDAEFENYYMEING